MKKRDRAYLGSLCLLLMLLIIVDVSLARWAIFGLAALLVVSW